MATTSSTEASSAPDAFVSHSSRDKRLFVRPLVECLAEQGAHVWYDEYAMAPGDSLSVSIDRGLASARMGIVIISPAFIETARESGWTSYELRGLVSNSIGLTGRRILPVWLDVSPEEVRAWSPPISDLLAVDASSKPLEEVCLEILRVIAPDRAGGLARMRALQGLRQGSTPEEAELGDLQPSPIVDRRVPGNVPLRALLVTQQLSDCGAPALIDFERFLENLARDLHHEEELRLWEAIAASYSVACKSFGLDQDQRTALCSFLLMASMGRADERAMEVLGAEVTGPAWEHLSSLLPLVSHDAVIGEGGLRVLLEPSGSDEQCDLGDAEPNPN